MKKLFTSIVAAAAVIRVIAYAVSKARTDTGVAHITMPREQLR